MPPDETSLVGVCHGLAQSGLLVVCEIPYAKYLDCGMDMFAEVVASNWLTARNTLTASGAAEGVGSKGGAGMIIRMQGFDRGIFGGNFHTHNALPLLPGLDVVVHSNGSDWVKGWRYAVKQAAAGRVVMVVDSTDLLNRRHIDIEARDSAMLVPYPSAEPSEELSFDVVLRHDGQASGSKPDDLTIVTYGNGVVAARQSQLMLAKESINAGILEVPCVSQVPREVLSKAIEDASGGQRQPVLFADVCKAQQAPLNFFAVDLSNAGLIGARAGRDWALVAAAQTYNPLGSTVTFLSEGDITAAARSLLSSK